MAILSDIMIEVDAARDRLIGIARDLVRIRSETPPSDTREAAETAAGYLGAVAGAETTLHHREAPVDNVVSVLRAGRPGKRLVLNGHLDTYPAGDPAGWSDDNPFSARLDDGRIWGRGAADMKGGIAAAMTAFECLSRHRDAWAGELVLTLAGDEERMGEFGTQFLLDTVPEARGDAAIVADVGSPQVPRVGEKGMIWIDVRAGGRAAHGAHVHRGVSAVDRLRQAMDALASLRDRPVDVPADVAAAIAAAEPVSEALAGPGETRVLRSLTVNFGRLEAGEAGNLVAADGALAVDIRLPNGVTVAEIETEIYGLLDPIAGVGFDVTRRYEPTWTPPDDPVVEAVCAAGKAVLGEPPRPNGRIGGSDARLFRAAGIPAVVCGLTPHNLGAPDEYAEVGEMLDLAKILAHAAFSFLAEP